MSNELPDQFFRADAPVRFECLMRVWKREAPEAQRLATARMKAMPYEEFLATTYWKTVRDYMAHRWRGLCQACLVNRSTEVHHKTYEHRGEEHLHLDDLMPVCRKCHEELEAREGRDHGPSRVRGWSTAGEVARKIGREVMGKQEHKTHG